MNLTATFPTALILAPLGLLLLILFRLLRAKRTLVLAGSLLIWKRLAALPATTKPRRIVLDLSLYLQAGAVLVLVAAMSGPSLVPQSASARTVLIVLDNGPLSRARISENHPAFEHITAQSNALFGRLGANDRVFVARAAPIPTVINSTPLTPAQAQELAAKIVPALSGPGASDLWLFATDRARTLAAGAPAQAAIVSLQTPPPESRGTSISAKWFGAALETRRFENVAIVAAGSLTMAARPSARILVRLANFSDQRANGTVALDALDGAESRPLEEQPLSIEPNAEAVAGFSIAPEIKSALRIVWRRTDKKSDALPEDDSVVLAPRPARPPRIRFHTPHPALEKLFRYALDAEIIAPGGADSAPNAAPHETDLDVYAGSVPERLPDDSRAALFVAPERGYRSFFDMGEAPFQGSGIQRGDDSPLTVGIGKSSGDVAVIPTAFEILHTGDFTTLLRDGAGRAVAAKFIDDKARPGYVLGFSPEGTQPEPLAAMLTRMALEAARTGPPYRICKSRRIGSRKKSAARIGLAARAKRAAAHRKRRTGRDRIQSAHREKRREFRRGAEHFLSHERHGKTHRHRSRTVADRGGIAARGDRIFPRAQRRKLGEADIPSIKTSSPTPPSSPPAQNPSPSRRPRHACSGRRRLCCTR